MTDPMVAAVVSHWAPRIITQGVDYNDYLRATSRIERFEDWLDAWCETGDLHLRLGEEAEGQGRGRTAGEAFVRSALAYHFAKFAWRLDMDRHWEVTLLARDALYAAHRHLDPDAQRVEVPFADGPLVGNLRRPPGEGPAPLALLLPGLDSTKEEFFHWEEVFLSRGMATFSLDGPGQGESGRTTQIRPDYEAAVAAALDALDGKPGLDLGRVGAVGVSLGGYYAPRALAFEDRLTAAAAIAGPYDFGACWERLPEVTRQAFRVHSGAADDEEARLLAGRLSLEGVTERITRPLLVVFGKQDRLIPWQHAERLAQEAPGAELVMYPEGNHVCNNIPYRYRPLVGDWMAERLVA